MFGLDGGWAKNSSLPRIHHTPRSLASAYSAVRAAVRPPPAHPPSTASDCTTKSHVSRRLPVPPWPRSGRLSPTSPPYIVPPSVSQPEAAPTSPAGPAPTDEFCLRSPSTQPRKETCPMRKVLA